jgi:hypothetical protein
MKKSRGGRKIVVKKRVANLPDGKSPVENISTAQRITEP